MKLKILFCIALCATPVFLFAATENFTRTLHLGLRGEDVRELQKVLNQDSETRIAEVGTGSSGNETDYFGPATKRALIKFQEKYKGEILAPSGLVSGNGILGARTRAKIVSLRNIIHTSTTTQALDSKGKVIVMFPSQYSGKSGTVVTISGAGFTKTDNTIYFGDGHAVEKAASPEGQSITFKIPAIPKGEYPLFVKNMRGESNKDSFFVVTDGVTPEPAIENITPPRVARGATVTIKGAGFTPAGNTIRTGVKIYKNLSSTNGTEISFTVPLDIFVSSTTTKYTKKPSFPIWVYVVNENGVSKGKSFDLEL